MRRASDWTWWNETCAIAERHARGASDAADDLAQDMAVAALEEGERVQRVGAWLERVGRNAEIDRWRAEGRRRELAAAVEAPAAPADPEQRLLAVERRGVVRRALAALPRPLRRAALARFAAELPFEAVAARLGTEPVTARTRVHRALARLRPRVGGLRAIFFLPPGAQAAVLSAALVAGAPASAPVSAVAPATHERSLHERRVAGTPPNGSGTPAAAPASPAAPAPTAGPAPAPPAAAAPARALAHGARAPAPAPPAFPPAVQRIPFEDDRVEGSHDGPDEPVIQGEPVIQHLSLIELRWHLLPEMVKSLEDL
jgi:RNA polymerase sigma factor (sigma-70 family)